MQQLEVETVFWLRISQVARTIHGGGLLRDEMDLVSVDEASTGTVPVHYRVSSVNADVQPVPVQHHIMATQR
jgi:hypothetical protein